MSRCRPRSPSNAGERGKVPPTFWSVETNYFHDGLVSGSWSLAKNEDGSATLTGMSIFRAGEFRNSKGQNTEWKIDDLHAMASNFSVLRPTFPNVPVRRDHVRSVDNVIGYFDQVYVKGDNLYGDFRITEPDAVEKFERGTFRSRSIEVGPYESNSGDITFPTVLGLAMVDIPAVEGLFQRHDPKEAPVADEFTQEDLDWAVACGYAQAASDTETDFTKDLEWAVACGYAEADVAVRAEMADKDKAPFMFQMGDGDTSSEFASVQRRLDALNQFVDEVTSKAREDFIDTLVKDEKIGAPQRDDLVAFAGDLTAEQFTTFRATYEAAPKLGVLSYNNDDGGKGPDPKSPIAIEYATAQEVVAHHKRSGMSEAEIQNTDSFKAMVALEAQLEKETA